MIEIVQEHLFVLRTSRKARGSHWDALTVCHKSTGLLPFMLLAIGDKDDLGGVYEILRMKPDVLKRFDSSLSDSRGKSSTPGLSFNIDEIAVTPSGMSRFDFGAPSELTPTSTDGFSFDPSTKAAVTNRFTFGATASAPSPSSRFSFGATSSSSASTSQEKTENLPSSKSSP